MNSVLLLFLLGAVPADLWVDDPQGAKTPAPQPGRPAAKAPTKLEDAINLALQNHPDIRIAEAELRVAEAKVAQARLLITQKVSAAHADLAVAKADLQAAEQNFGRMAELEKRRAVAAEEIMQARARLEQARASAAAKEAAFHQIVGLPTGISAVTQLATKDYIAFSQGELHFSDALAGRLLAVDYGVIRANLVPPQPVADKLKAALDKPVRMEKQQGAELEACLKELFKRANLDVKVRLPVTENKQITREITKLDLDEDEYPLRVWLQLVLDETNNYRNMRQQTFPTAGQKPVRYDLYLREYGLLLSTPDLAPPDAMTVQQFWKQVQAAPAKGEGQKGRN